MRGGGSRVGAPGRAGARPRPRRLASVPGRGRLAAAACSRAGRSASSDSTSWRSRLRSAACDLTWSITSPRPARSGRPATRRRAVDPAAAECGEEALVDARRSGLPAASRSASCSRTPRARAATSAWRRSQPCISRGGPGSATPTAAQSADQLPASSARRGLEPARGGWRRSSRSASRAGALVSDLGGSATRVGLAAEPVGQLVGRRHGRLVTRRPARRPRRWPRLSAARRRRVPGGPGPGRPRWARRPGGGAARGRASASRVARSSSSIPGRASSASRSSVVELGLEGVDGLGRTARPASRWPPARRPIVPARRARRRPSSRRAAGPRSLRSRLVEVACFRACLRALRSAPGRAAGPSAASRAAASALRGRRPRAASGPRPGRGAGRRGGRSGRAARPGRRW